MTVITNLTELKVYNTTMGLLLQAINQPAPHVLRTLIDPRNIRLGFPAANDGRQFANI